MDNSLFFWIIIIGFAVCILGNIATSALAHRKQFRAQERKIITFIGLLSLLILLIALVHFAGIIIFTTTKSELYYVFLSLSYAILGTLSANVLTMELFSEEPNNSRIIIIIIDIALLCIALFVLA
jgi:uncharacterized membrane protein